MDFNRLIVESGAYFYAIAFAGTFLEGETIVLFAGFAAAQGLVNPTPLLAAACLGTFSGDQLYFWIGRSFGSRLLRRFPPWRRGVEAALSALERYNAGFILSFRFIYGIRNVSSFAMGLSAIDWKRFLWLNFLAAALWAAIFTGFGYFLGHALRAALGDVVRSFSLGMLAAFAALATAIGLIERFRKRRRSPFPMPAAIVAPPPGEGASGLFGKNFHAAADLEAEDRRGVPAIDGDLGKAVGVLVPEGSPRRAVGEGPGARENAAAGLQPRR
jgi:membrane protein DedA with SNARE-associated domain